MLCASKTLDSQYEGTVSEHFSISLMHVSYVFKSRNVLCVISP